jgi:hypothetical protein
LENANYITARLMVSTLAITDVLAKLLTEKGVITDAEFTEKLLQVEARSTKDSCSMPSPSGSMPATANGF